MKYNIEHYKNPKYKERFNGFFWGFVVGYIPYLWHMYVQLICARVKSTNMYSLSDTSHRYLVPIGGSPENLERSPEYDIKLLTYWL